MSDKYVLCASLKQLYQHGVRAGEHEGKPRPLLHGLEDPWVTLGLLTGVEVLVTS